jgi:hypothetical protein
MHISINEFIRHSLILGVLVVEKTASEPKPTLRSHQQSSFAVPPNTVYPSTFEGYLTIELIFNTDQSQFSYSSFRRCCVSSSLNTVVSLLLLKKQKHGSDAAQRLHHFLLRGLPRVFGSVEIQRRFSSSSLPPYFVSGRLAAIFYNRRHPLGIR